MATATFNVIPRSTSDADFRAWGSAVAAQLAAIGLVQTADTGQINWTTVVRPAINSSGGYEIWRFDDALQATAPVVLRIDYAASSSQDRPAIWVTPGTGTDGAGNMNPGSLPRMEARSGSSSASSVTCYLCGAAGRFMLAFSASASGTVIFIGVERTKDAAGQDTGDGLLLFWTDGSGTAWRSQYYYLGVGSPGLQSGPSGVGLGCLMPSVGSGIGDGNTSIYPCRVSLGPFLPYGLNLFAYFHADIPALTPITFTVYGASHTFLPLGNTVASGAVVTGSAMMIRWE